MQAWSQFRRERLEVGRVEAPDALSVEEPRGHRSAGLRACGNAHRLAWREARQRGEDAVIVFEDDVILCHGFRDRLAATMAVLPPDWMVLYFGCVLQTPPLMVAPGLLRVTGPTWDLHGYAIRRPLWECVSAEIGGASCRRRVSGPLTLCPDDDPEWWSLSPRERGRRRTATANDLILADYHTRFPAYAVWPPMAWQAYGLSNNENAVRGNYRKDGTQSLYRHAIRHLPGVNTEERPGDHGTVPVPSPPRAKPISAPTPMGSASAGKRPAGESPPPVGQAAGVMKAGIPDSEPATSPVHVRSTPNRETGKGRGFLLSPYSVRTERMAWRMAESLRKHSPGIPLQVFAQDYLPTLPWRGLAAVKVARGWHTGSDDLRWVNKLEAVANSPFDETLFFDCDMLALEPVDHWFEALGADDLGFWTHLRSPAESADRLEFNLMNPHRFCPHYGVAAVPTMIGGGHYFVRKSGRSERLLRRMATIMLEATGDPAALYWRLAGEGNIIGDEPAASMAAVEESVKLPVVAHGAKAPVGCFMPPWQRWIEADPAAGVMRYACEWTKQEVSPSVIHFAGTGKDDPVYAKFVDDVRTLVPATC